MASDSLRYKTTKELLTLAAEMLIDLHDPFPEEHAQRLLMRRWLRVLRVLNGRLDVELEDALHDERCVCDDCWLTKGYDPRRDS